MLTLSWYKTLYSARLLKLASREMQAWQSLEIDNTAVRKASKTQYGLRQFLLKMQAIQHLGAKATENYFLEKETI